MRWHRRQADRSRRAKRVLFGTIALLTCLGNYAWAAPIGPLVGQVGALEVMGSGAGAPGNYDYRFYLAGNPTLCNGQLWAYINITDANYSALVSSLLLAKALNSTVSFYVNQDTNGYCQLAYIASIN